MNSMETVHNQIGDDRWSSRTVPNEISGHLLQAKSKYKIGRQIIILSIHVGRKNSRWSGTIADRIAKALDNVHISRKSSRWSEMITDRPWSCRKDRKEFYFPNEIIIDIVRLMFSDIVKIPDSPHQLWLIFMIFENYS